MMSIYYQNGHAWIGDRKTTYHRARTMAGPLEVPFDVASNVLGGAKITDAVKQYMSTPPVNLNDIPDRNPEVKSGQVSFIAELVKMLMSVTTDRQHITWLLEQRGIPVSLIRAALHQVFPA